MDAQEAGNYPAAADSTALVVLKNPVVKRPRFNRNSIELFASQPLPWAYNRYIRKADFAKISFSSLLTNFEPRSWEWDDNKFINNHFSHPYHGSIHYHSFRTNGYGFGASSLATVAGSLIWEIGWETHYPAPNDLINTSL